MSILRRKKKDDEELDEELDKDSEADDKKKPLRKKTRKKEKENKEWGKKERYLVLIVFFITIIASAGLAISARDWKLPNVPRLGISDWSLKNVPLVGSQTIVLESDNPNMSQKQSEVVDLFQTETHKLSGVYGLYVIDLESGYSFGVNDDKFFEPASLGKLPVMFAAFREAERGRFDIDAEYTLINDDKIGGAGSLYGKAEGSVYTYRELVRLMGKESDNTAYNVVKKAVGEEAIQKALSELGMNDTSYDKNQTTPKDIGTFFDRLYTGSLLSTRSRDEILSNLTDTQYEAWIAAGVPDGVRVAHKFGREVHVVNDAGIIYDTSPFVLVILSKGVVEKEADNAFPLITKLIYDAYSN